MNRFSKVIIALFSLGSLPLSAILDDDGDGMSDIWEAKFGAEGLLPDQDTDNDGASNLEESSAGTNPLKATSHTSLRLISFPEEFALGWDCSPGERFIVEEGTLSNESEWLSMGGPYTAGGPRAIFPLSANQSGKGFFRVRRLDRLDQAVHLFSDTGTNQGPQFAREIFEGSVSQYPFDPRSLGIEKGFRTLVWYTEEGKNYTIQKQSLEGSGESELFAAGVKGTGGYLTFSFIGQDDSHQSDFRLVVSDLDSDDDGLSDWEELVVGTDPRNPRTDPDGEGDRVQVLGELQGTSEVMVESIEAVANLSRGSSGIFKISRVRGIQELGVNFIITGSARAEVDFASPDGSLEFSGVIVGRAVIPFGKSAVEIEIDPLDGSRIALSASVVLTIEKTLHYTLADPERQSASVNIVREVALNVRDFGAVGDGMVDDTLSVQIALDTLASSRTHNTLHFPAGTYRLDTLSPDYYTKTSKWHLLTFGVDDLQGRDLFFTGEEGSRLYSTVSPVRAHMMVVLATFRSLSSFGMTWQKDNELLSPVSTGNEPNGADGVSLVAVGNQIIEHVRFTNCQFINCHGALMTTANGIDRRGYLRELGFYHCELLNPYGSNTTDGGTAWGGGQQTYLSQWVGKAIYEGNLFEGGGEDMRDGPYTNGGRLKDAAMIGGPVQLFFKNNTVRKMGIESVFISGKANFLSTTLSGVEVPAPNGSEVAVVEIDSRNTPSTFVVGSQIVIRIPTTNDTNGIDNIFEVVGFDPENDLVSFVNHGFPSNSLEDFHIPSKAHIYLSEETARPLSEITGNVLDGEFPVGADSQSYSVAITVNSRALVSNNRINGWKVGVMSYDDGQIYHRATGLIVRDNLIVVKDTSDLVNDVYHVGVRSWASSQLIESNTIIIPNSRKTFGISVYGRGSSIQNNFLYTITSEDHAYTSLFRSVGISHGNRSSLTTVTGNITRGFNVGVGPATSSQSIPYIVRDHTSIDDTLPIDPRGLVDQFEDDLDH